MVVYICQCVSHNLSPSLHPLRRRQWHPTPVLLPGKSHGQRSQVGCSPWGREESNTTEQLPFPFHALEKAMATHSSVLAWRIPGTGEPGGLPSMGSHRVRHNWSDLAAVAAPSSLCSQVHFLRLCLYSCFTNGFIRTIFLDSISMRQYTIFAFLFLTYFTSVGSRFINKGTVNRLSPIGKTCCAWKGEGLRIWARRDNHYPKTPEMVWKDSLRTQGIGEAAESLMVDTSVSTSASGRWDSSSDVICLPL